MFGDSKTRDAVADRIDSFEFVRTSRPSGEVGGDLVDVFRGPSGRTRAYRSHWAAIRSSHLKVANSGLDEQRLHESTNQGPRPSDLRVGRLAGDGL